MLYIHSTSLTLYHQLQQCEFSECFTHIYREWDLCSLVYLKYHQDYLKRPTASIRSYALNNRTSEAFIRVNLSNNTP